MSCRSRLWILVSLFLLTLAAAPVSAQESSSGTDGATSGGTASNSADTDGDESTSDSGEESGSQEEESAHGSYDWKPSYGGGVEYGLFFTGLERWNTHVLEPNNAKTFDFSALSNITLAFEASLLEGSRITLFGGLESPFNDNPGISAVYGGLEPAFAFRRGMWEMGLGFGVGVGSVTLKVGEDREFGGGIVILRPAFEVRRYINEYAAGYVRAGFNQWMPFNTSSETLDIVVRENAPAQTADESLLHEGGVYVALGARFGVYPEHKKTVPDTDGDGLRDDVDDCPEEAEDEDGFEDQDGCPDPDNDGDGIPDEEDKCPDKPEDEDSYKDDDGCPDEAGDDDGDGVLNKNDACPDEPEDKDGFEDDDGCPDPDNDGDTIPDEEDECPDEMGIPSENGCPSDIVEVGEDELLVSEAIEFEAKEDAETRTVLTDGAKETLDVVAEVLGVHEELAKVEIQSHTGEGDEEAKKKESQKRAEAVQTYLVGEGIAKSRLVAKGYGASKPVEKPAEEKTETDKKKDGEKDDGGKDDGEKNGAEKDAETKPTSRVEFHILEREEPESKGSPSEKPESKGTPAEESESKKSPAEESESSSSKAPSDGGSESQSKENADKESGGEESSEDESE